MKSRAIVFSARSKVELQTVEIPDPEVGEVLVRAEYSCVSPGTEARVLNGTQVGHPGFPVISGYATVGRVEAGDPAWIGKRVIYAGTRRASISPLWGGHIEFGVAASDRVVEVPEAVDPVAASATQLVAIAFRGVRKAKALPHETVFVVGLGPIGQFSARWFSASGCRVIGIDPLPERRAAFAAETAASDQALELLPDGADVVVDCTGAPAAFARSVLLAKQIPWGSNVRNARLIIQGSYPDTFVVDYDSAFVRELDVMFPRATTQDDWVASLSAMERGVMDARAIISRVVKPGQAAEAFGWFGTDPSVLTIAFDWN
jgi:2-desacetyl-2-hydroxyethyl bacteriochlorophyllide A dehydrogenase